MLSVSIPPPQCLKKPLAVPQRHMFGPGPSNVPPQILEAAAKPVIGHMHPEIFQVISHNTRSDIEKNPNAFIASCQNLTLTFTNASVM